MTALILGSCARTSHTPGPSEEGSFEMLLFYLIMNDLWRGCFPSREGIKGCVMVRGAGWGEMILLLFGGVVFLGLRVTALILGSCARTSHTPAPSQEGRFVVLLSSW